MAEVFYGLGRHKHFLSTYQQSRFRKFDFLDWIQVFVTLALMKISILLFLLRLSKFAHLRRFLIFLVVFIILTHLPLTVLMITNCQPVYKFWLEEVSGTCWPKATREKIVIVQGGMCVVREHLWWLKNTSYIDHHGFHWSCISHRSTVERRHSAPQQDCIMPPYGFGGSVRFSSCLDRPSADKVSERPPLRLYALH